MTQDFAESEELALKLIRDSDWFKPEAEGWVAKDIVEGESDLHIRAQGRLLSKDEKRALGLAANAKIGSEYIEALTETGLEYAMQVADIVSRRYFHVLARADLLESFRKMNAWGASICGAHDDRTCDRAKELNHKIFPLDRLPALPLPECDQEYCRCTYLAVMRKPPESITWQEALAEQDGRIAEQKRSPDLPKIEVSIREQTGSSERKGAWPSAVGKGCVVMILLTALGLVILGLFALIG
jgi:hypothetical protein